jgi:hypothetical protein
MPMEGHGLSRQLHSTGSSEVTVALQGTLDTFALPDVLRLLASTKKTGRLVIAGNRGTGSVWVDSGSVVASDATGAMPDAKRADVLFELLRYSDGSFTFDSGTTTDQAAPPQDVEILLADAERQLREWREIEAVIPSVDAWLSLVGDTPEDEIVISADTWRTIVTIGSGTTVAAVGHVMKLGELDVCRRAKELVEQGLVKVTTTPTPRAMDEGMSEVAAPVVADEPVATFDAFTIEIPGVDEIVPNGSVTTTGHALEIDDDVEDDDYEVEDEYEDVDEGADDIDDMSVADDDAAEAAEVARQLASLSPKAAQAVAAASRARTNNAAGDGGGDVDDDDEPVDRGLLLKFLSSVKS